MKNNEQPRDRPHPKILYVKSNDLLKLIEFLNNIPRKNVYHIFPIITTDGEKKIVAKIKNQEIMILKLSMNIFIRNPTKYDSYKK